MSARDSFRWIPWVGGVGLAALVAAQIFGFVTSAPERDMGHLQKILYVHLPVIWMAFIAIFIVLVKSIQFLIRRNERDDLLAASAAELGAVFLGTTLCLGAIWAKPTWGVFWTWDARITSTTVLFLIFVGYLALRAFTEDFERRATWSAAIGILGALNVPIVYMSVRWWRTIHQIQSSPETVDPSYVLSLRLNGVALLIVTIYLIARRYQVALMEREREYLSEVTALEGFKQG